MPRTGVSPQIRVESPFAQIAHARRKAAHAGENKPRTAVQAARLATYNALLAEELERLLHRTQIAHAVIENARHASTPFEEGILSETIAAASRTHSANALKIASASWWALPLRKSLM